MAELKVTGVLKSIDAISVKSEKFKTRKFVISITDNGYTNDAQFQANNRVADALDGYQVGQNITVSFNFKSFVSNQGKTFYSLEAWRIEK